MILEGVMIGGRVILDAPTSLPDGTRVRIEPVLDPDDIGPPEEPYDRDKELAILREAYEDVQAGRGVNARHFLKELASQYDLPLEPGE
jgi:hypothetical protein